VPGVTLTNETLAGHSIAPAGAGSEDVGVRWFPLADSLHHRL